MRHLLVSFLAAAICVALLGSCKKDKTLTELLTANCWVATAITLDPPFPNGSTTVIDLYAELSPCDRDDIRCFELTTDYTLEEGLTKCDDLDPVVYEYGIWSFFNEELILTTPTLGDAMQVEVIKLKEGEFVFRILFDEINDTKYYATYTCEPNG